jgi:hypothetical protein
MPLLVKPWIGKPNYPADDSQPLCKAASLAATLTGSGNASDRLGSKIRHKRMDSTHSLVFTTHHLETDLASGNLQA